MYKNTMPGAEATRPPDLFFKWLEESDSVRVMNSNVYEFDTVFKFQKYGKEVLNDCQKPLYLAERLVYTYGGNSGTWVLDLCAGSGTFTVAALRRSMHCCAVDISERMCQGIKQRILECLTEDGEAELKPESQDETESQDEPEGASTAPTSAA